MKCLKRFDCRFGLKSLPPKITHFIKKVKPAIGFWDGKRRTNAVTPSTCNYDIRVNEESLSSRSEFFDLHFRFIDETEENKFNELRESFENEKNERLENLIQSQKSEIRSKTVSKVPAMESRTFFRSDFEQWRWSSPDADLCYRGDFSATERQVANQQSPVWCFQ